MNGLLQFFQGPGAELKLVILLALVALVYFKLRKKKDGPSAAPQAPVVTVPAPVAAKPVQAAAAPKPVAAKPAPLQPQAPARKTVVASKPALPVLPQDSSLRRHFATHVRSVVEALAAPRPSDSVLRRHAEQWISQQVQACLQDPAKLQKLLDRQSGRRAAA